jgi:hypothetical protein
MFSLQQNQRTKGWNRSCPEAGVGGGVCGELVQLMYTHVSKCKNYKRKEKKNWKPLEKIKCPQIGYQLSKI